MKEYLTPLSIVIAGIFIGAGLYFGGGTTEIIQEAPEADNGKAEEADNTDQITPVTADEHIRGNFEAQVKIVEYSDFDCPFCGRYHDVMKNIVEKYSPDEVAWVYRHFPLPQLHPQAAAVAVASECVAEIGGNDAFWAFTDSYYAARSGGNNTSHGELIPQLVLEIGVAQAPFEECFESGRYEDAVQADADNAIDTGGRGTPWSIIIGPSGKTYPVNGALPQQSIEQMIELAKKEA